MRADCPHTLPAYARMLAGVVVGPDEHGALIVRFGEDHTYPIEAKWLVAAPADETSDAGG